MNYRNLTIYGYTSFLNRSANIDEVSQEDIHQLFDNNISTIIDLRKSSSGHVKFTDTDSLIIYNCPLSISLFFEDSNEKNMVMEYINIVSQKEVIQKIFHIIAHAKSNVLLTCSWGKDRTGVVFALIEMLAGIDEKIIIADYIESNKYTSELIADKRLPRYAQLAKETYISGFIEEFRKKYGEVYGFCREIGITEDEIETIKRKVIG